MREMREMREGTGENGRERERTGENGRERESVWMRKGEGDYGSAAKVS